MRLILRRYVTESVFLLKNSGFMYFISRFIDFKFDDVLNDFEFLIFYYGLFSAFYKSGIVFNLIIINKIINTLLQEYI